MSAISEALGLHDYSIPSFAGLNPTSAKAEKRATEFPRSFEIYSLYCVPAYATKKLQVNRDDITDGVRLAHRLSSPRTTTTLSDRESSAMRQAVAVWSRAACALHAGQAVFDGLSDLGRRAMLPVDGRRQYSVYCLNGKCMPASRAYSSMA